MNKNKLLSLFIKSLDSPTNINGLLLYPQLNEEKITWKLKNPNDLSYSNPVIDGYLEELLYDFMIMTGTKDRPEWGNWTEHCKLGNIRHFYINQELRDKINDACNKFTSIKLEDEGNELNSECYVMNWDIGYEDSEIFNFFISLELTNPKINDEEVDDDTLDEFIKEFIYNDTAGEQETDAIWNLITRVIDDKNMYDSSYMIANAVIGYFDQFGNSLT
jgi:hypothetical protein